jgi:hypothetical protein
MIAFETISRSLAVRSSNSCQHHARVYSIDEILLTSVSQFYSGVSTLIDVDREFWQMSVQNRP